MKTRKTIGYGILIMILVTVIIINAVAWGIVPTLIVTGIVGMLAGLILLALYLIIEK